MIEEKEEVWKDIAGYENIYQISNFGRVKVIRNNKERIIVFGKNRDGYLHVNLCNKNKIKTESVHRLVLITFLGIDQNKKEVNHKNGIKTDNNINNLEWCTRSENIKHADNLGLRKYYSGQDHPLVKNPAKAARGITNGNTKLTEKDIKEIRKLYKEENKTKRYLATKFNVTYENITSIIKRNTWKHIE